MKLFLFLGVIFSSIYNWIGHHKVPYSLFSKCEFHLFKKQVTRSTHIDTSA